MAHIRFSARRSVAGFIQAILVGVALTFASVCAASAQSLLRDSEIEAYLDSYTRPILKAAGIDPDSIQLLLIGDQTPNAFAGGRIMGFHTGLITTADTPNQIEGVIAHEAGHIAGGHTARVDDAMASVTRPMILSLLLAAGAAAAGAPEAGIGLLGLGQTIGVANYLKFSRSQESSADQAGLTYLDAVGSSGAGLLEFFGKLRNLQVIGAGKVNPYLQTHPLAGQRITALQERATQSSFYDVKDSDEEIYRLRMIQAKIFGFLQEARYTLRQYPLSDQSDPARYARAVAYYRGVDIDKGLKEINHLLDHHPQNPYFHELKGQMLFEYGKIAESVGPHRESVRLRPNDALFRINLGRALLALEDRPEVEEAVRELRQALRYEPDNSFAWFELARAYGALDNEPMAHLATAESRYHAGQKGEAGQFARRALPALTQGSPEWRQAQDIIAASEGADRRGRRVGQPRPGPDAPDSEAPEKEARANG